MSALRQALLLTAIFVGILVSAGFFVVSGFEDEFDRRTRLELQERFDTLAGEIAASGFDASDYPKFGMEQVFFLPDGQTSLSPLFRRLGFFEEDEDDDDESPGRSRRWS